MGKIHKIVLCFMSIFDKICIVYTDKIEIHTYILLTIGQVQGYTPDKRFRKEDSEPIQILSEWSDLK